MRRLRFLFFAAGMMLSHTAGASETFQVFPMFVNFGDVYVGSSSSESITVQNLTDRNIVSLSVFPTGYASGFDIQPFGCVTLPAHGSCTIWIMFRPLMSGLSHLTIQVNNAADTVLVDVSGDALEGPVPLNEI